MWCPLALPPTMATTWCCKSLRRERFCGVMATLKVPKSPSTCQDQWNTTAHPSLWRTVNVDEREVLYKHAQGYYWKKRRGQTWSCQMHQDADSFKCIYIWSRTPVFLGKYFLGGIIWFKFITKCCCLCRHLASHPGPHRGWGPLQCDCNSSEQFGHSDGCPVRRHLALWWPEQHVLWNIYGQQNA